MTDPLKNPTHHDGWTIALDVQQTRRKHYHALTDPAGNVERWDRVLSRLIDAARALGVTGPIDLIAPSGKVVGTLSGQPKKDLRKWQK